MITTDLVLVSAFLFLILIVGLAAGRNIKTFEDYAVGDKNFGTWMLVASLLATIYGGVTLSRLLEMTYNGDIHAIIEPLRAIGLLVVALFLASRMGEFLSDFSIAESMGRLYGKKVRIITAISGIIKSIGTIGAQFYVINIIMINTLLNVDYKVITLCTFIIVIIYSSFGGARSVVITDIIQFLIFGLFIPIVVACTIDLENSLPFASLLLNKLKISFETNLGDTPPIIFISALLTLLMPSVGPSSTQRVYMSKNTTQVKKTFLHASAIGMIIKVLIVVLGIVIFRHNHDLNPQRLLEHILSYDFMGIKILLCMSIIGLSMSTADSDLHVSTILFIHDIIEPIQGKKLQHKVLLAHIATVFIGLLGVLVARNTNSLLKVLMNSYNFYMPIVTVPFIMAILGFRPHRRSVIIGMLAGVIAAIIAKFYIVYSFYLVLPGVFSNLLFLIGSHYILPKSSNTGWVGIKDKGPLLAEKQADARKWEMRKEAFEHFFWSHYLKDIFPKNLTIF